MSKNKNTIRLTEEQLHQMVMESVNEVLTELDWKTYASAADKSLDRANSGYWRDKGVKFPDTVSKAADARYRSEKFGKAAKDAFNRDFGYKKGQSWDDDYAKVELGGDFDATEEFGPHAVGYKSKGYGNPKKYERGTDNSSFKKVSPEEFFDGNTDAANSFRNADQEVRNWKKGKFGYKKGQGWGLK
jgi:hypothetical protein